MARPALRTARKDYPQNGISKGEQYWFCQIKTGPRTSRTLRQKAPFKRSQLTSSDFLSQVYDIEDDLSSLTCRDDAEDIVSRLRDLADEQDDRFNNMPENLQSSEIGQKLETRRDGCQSAADEIEEIKDREFDEPETDEDGKPASAEYIEAKRQEWEDECLDEIRNVSIDY